MPIRIMILWGKEAELMNDLLPLKKYKIYYDRTRELEEIKQKLIAYDIIKK
jgi:hypothetical protein